jgi:hypothetical protein
MFKKYTRLRGYIIPLLLVVFAFVFNGCHKDEEGSNGTTHLDSFGPSPALRGGELKFIGTGLDKISSIILPGDVNITTFKTKTPELIVIDIPQEAVEGAVVLKSPDGDITTKTPLGISEPISITSITPALVRPGDVITIEGEYLNLISEVVFPNNKSVTEFESQSRPKIEVKVPLNAQTGKIALSNGEEIPIVVTSETDLEIALPVATEITPSTIKAGDQLTIKGTNLDLTSTVVFSGDKSVSTFVSKTATQLVVVVPADAKDGKINLVAASDVRTEVPTSLTLVVPTIASVTPNPAKNSGIITVTGTNLDLISSVTFGGSKTGEIQTGRTATEIKVKVPADAVDGIVNFNTQAGKSVPSSQSLTLVVPSITSITPLSVNTVDAPSITITGTNLDVVKTVVFGGENWTAETDKAISISATEIKIPVTPGALTGKIKIITTNGTEVTSTETLTIVPNVPNITVVPEIALIGNYMTMEGTNIDVEAEIIFPGNVKATSIGSKTATKLVVMVPASVAPGVGKVKFVTSKNEIYESPSVTFKFPGTEPIQSAALIINGYDESGHDLNWDNWGGNVELGNDPNIAISGKYLHGTKASLSGWSWIWGCNHSQLVKPSVTTADHLLKLDVKITKAIPAGTNFQMELSGSRIDLGNLGGSTPNGGWVTITYDLSTFGGLPATIPASGEWGINMSSGTGVDLTGLYIDNIRFHKK